MSEILKKFGRYFLFDMIAQGGMAEIYRARMAGEDNGGRLLVIKRIQDGLGSNSEFREMFKSEIKVTQRFQHPNIVQVFDYGEETNQPYIAMEWVDGRNLRQILNRFGEQKKKLPIGFAVSIIEQSASALHYAHSFKDKMTGESLELVHRDVSPQNILVSYEGVVKLIDFGIAKATTNSEATRAGVIKGKISYLSPEQINGDKLDGRSDLFALGIVLWELLVGKKLFQGDSDLAVLKQIENCNTHVKPPSSLNPDVPKELDYIVLKALAKQREKRYQTGEEMQRELHKFLVRFDPDYNPSDLSYSIRDSFKNEIVEDRKKIQKLSDKVDQLMTTAVPSSTGPGASGPSPDLVYEAKGMSPLNLEQQDDTTSVLSKQPSKAAPVASPVANLKKVSPAPAVVELEKPRVASRTVSRQMAPLPGQTQTQTHNQTSRSTGSVTARVASPSAQQKSSGGGGILKWAAAAVFLLLVGAYVGPQFGVQIPVLSGLLHEMKTGGGAHLTLSGHATNVRVLVNGRQLSSSLPAEIGPVPVGESFKIQVVSEEGTFEQDLVLSAGENRVIPVVFPAQSPERMISSEALSAAADVGVASAPTSEAAQNPGTASEVQDVGFLTIKTTPSAEATIELPGQRKWVRKTPFVRESLPVGHYSVKLVNEVLGMEKVLQIEVGKNQTVLLDDIRLEVKR